MELSLPTECDLKCVPVIRQLTVTHFQGPCCWVRKAQNIWWSGESWQHYGGLIQGVDTRIIRWSCSSSGCDGIFRRSNMPSDCRWIGSSFDMGHAIMGRNQDDVFSIDFDLVLVQWWHHQMEAFSALPVTGPLCGEFTGHRWIPFTKAKEAELWCFFLFAPEESVVQTIETPMIWDAIALIMTSL